MQQQLQQQIQQLQAELAALARHKQQLEAAIAHDAEVAHIQAQRHQQATSQLTQEAELLNGKLIKLRASRDDLQRELYGLKERKIRLLEDIEKLQAVEEQMISEVSTLQRHKKALLQETPYLDERARASAALALVYEYLRVRVIELSAAAPGALAADAASLDLEACTVMAPRLNAALGPPARPPASEAWQAAALQRASSSASGASPQPPAGSAGPPMQRSGSFASAPSHHHYQQEAQHQPQHQPQQHQQPQQEGSHPYLATALAVTSAADIGPSALHSSGSWVSQGYGVGASMPVSAALQQVGSAPAWLHPTGASPSRSSTPRQSTGPTPSRASTPLPAAASEPLLQMMEVQGGSRDHGFDMASLAALLQQHNLGDGEALRQLQRLLQQQHSSGGHAGGSGSLTPPGRAQQPPPPPGGSGAGLASYPPPRYKPMRMTGEGGASGSGGAAANVAPGAPQQAASKGVWLDRLAGEQGQQHPDSEPLPATLPMTQEQLAQLAAWGAEGIDTATLFKLHSM